MSPPNDSLPVTSERWLPKRSIAVDAVFKNQQQGHNGDTYANRNFYPRREVVALDALDLRVRYVCSGACLRVCDCKPFSVGSTDVTLQLPLVTHLNLHTSTLTGSKFHNVSLDLFGKANLLLFFRISIGQFHPGPTNQQPNQREREKFFEHNTPPVGEFRRTLPNRSNW